MKNTGFRWDARRKIAVVSLYVPGSRGKRRRQLTIRGKSYTEALSLYGKFREETIQLGRLKGADHTLTSYTGEFWPKLRLRVSEGTRVLQDGLLRDHILPTLGRLKLAAITRPVLDDLAAELAAKGLSVSTINNVMSLVRRLRNDARNREFIAAVPVGGVPIQKVAPPANELSPDEVRAFLAAFHDEAGFRALMKRRRPGFTSIGLHFQRFSEARPFFVLALHTGLRRGDLLSLRWSHVDLGSGRIRLVTGKTKERVDIPISAECRAALEELRTRRVPETDLVMLTGFGHPLPITSVVRYFAIAKRLAGITRPFRFHDARHSFGSRLGSAGVTLQVIARAYGHRDLKTTMRYVRPSEEAAASIQDALDTWLDTASKESRAVQPKSVAKSTEESALNGAGDRDRTGDIQLGKQEEASTGTTEDVRPRPSRAPVARRLSRPKTHGRLLRLSEARLRDAVRYHRRRATHPDCVRPGGAA